MSRKRLQKLLCVAAVSPLAAMLGCDAEIPRGGGLSSTNAALVSSASNIEVSGPKASLLLKIGDSGIYRISYAGTTDIDFGLISQSMANGFSAGSKEASRRVTNKHERKATFHWRVIGEDASGWTLAARLQNVDFRIDQTADSRTELLEQPFTLRLDRNGKMRDFTFRKGYSEELALAVRGMVEPLQVVLADDGDGKWSAREDLQEVTLATQYRRTHVDAAKGSMSLVRDVTSASPSQQYASSLSPLGKLSISVTNAESKIDLALSGRGVQRIEMRQTVTANARKGFVSSHDDLFIAESTSGRLASLPNDLSEANAILAEVVQKNLYAVDSRALPEISGRDVKAIMADFTTTLSANMARGHRLLTNYVRYYPERSLELARALDAYSGDEPDKFVGFGFSAMATAGHVEAQRVLVSVATESGWSSLSRERAISAMLDLEYPQPETMAAVWRLRNAPPGTGPFAAVIQSIATNVYGFFGDVQKGNKANTATVVQNLGALLNGSNEFKQQVFALSALSNVGDLESVLPLVEPFFASDRVELRTRAFANFRRMTGPVAFQKFANYYAAEKSSEVRLSAVRTVEQMEASEARNEWAVNEVARETDADTVRVLVKIIGLGIEAHPENANVLRSLLDTQTDRAVRRAIYAFVSPQPKGGK